MEVTMKRTLSFLSGALMGALVGTTLAVLLAPASGEELRAQIQERVQTFQHEVQQAASSRRADLERQLSALRQPKPGTPES
jgi:gas vesicle protein